MKRLQSTLWAILSGALVSACGEGLDAPDATIQGENTTEQVSTKQPVALSPELAYAVIPIRPSAGSSHSAGQTVTIEWGLITGGVHAERAGLLSDFIKLDLYKWGRFHSSIASSLPLEQWTYDWQIPADISSGSLYSIHLTSVSNPSLFSDGDWFSIQGTGCDFRFELESLYVARDQRTATLNYEGKLELTGVFRAASVETPRFPATGSASMSQGATILPQLFIADFRVHTPTTVPVEARLLEIDNGTLEGDDSGSTVGSFSLDCAQSGGTRDLPVTLSDDSAFEKEGQVVARIRATRL